MKDYAENVFGKMDYKKKKGIVKKFIKRVFCDNKLELKNLVNEIITEELLIAEPEAVNFGAFGKNGHHNRASRKEVV